MLIPGNILNLTRIAIFIVVASLLSGCSVTQSLPTATPSPSPIPSSTPFTVIGIGDASYGGHAFVDENGNGIYDEKDSPLAGAILYLEINNGINSAVATEDGFAIIRFPIVARQSFTGKMWMEPPNKDVHELISPQFVEVRCCTGDANFLFRKKRK